MAEIAYSDARAVHVTLTRAELEQLNRERELVVERTGIGRPALWVRVEVPACRS
jgi:hypothetical protein